MMTGCDDLFWKRKLAAFLHDPPSKALDAAGREAAAEAFRAAAGLAGGDGGEGLLKSVEACEVFSAAAERVGFPKGACAHDFKADPLFIHPLSGERHPFAAGLGEDAADVEGALRDAAGGLGAGVPWKEKFFLYWRRWMEEAAASGRKGAECIPFLPADSRIPDHSVWAHDSLASALAACLDGGGKLEMEFLLFQFGPVQEFIAQARSTRDLWSGSYLLSWLSAHAMKAVTDRIGPDGVIFPSLRGNGIFDAMHRDSFYARRRSDGGRGEEETVWERIAREKGGGLAEWLLTPTLPNRFFAVVPAGRGAELARAAEEALRRELRSIGGAVWEWLERQGAAGHDDWKARFDRQIEAFPQITWAVQAWPSREEILRQCEAVSPATCERVREILKFAEETLPAGKRDPRYYDEATGRSVCDAVLWPAVYELLNAKLAARRNTRDFPQWDDPAAKGAVKDSLSGKEECVGDEAFWEKLRLEKHRLFGKAKGHRYGAMNLVKRLWCVPGEVDYLPKRLGLKTAETARALRYDSLEDVAAAGGGKYVALLALDGDSMGKWISGENAPALVEHLAPEIRASLSPLPGGAGLRRMLTPSYHLQFSEALSNFAIYKAREVVERYDGELIYAGGDDVLAIVPAKRAIACARAVREAFRTDYGDGRLYPGSKTDMSCGIAVGHCNAPLQMLVKEAQRMEGVAKNAYGRSAVAIALYKRSGEIIEWGCKWEYGAGGGSALDLMERVTELTGKEQISGRFPYALAALLRPYALEKTEGALDDGMCDVVRQEVRHVLKQQGLGMKKDDREELAEAIGRYLTETRGRAGDFINLFLTETFINRARGEE